MFSASAIGKSRSSLCDLDSPCSCTPTRDPKVRKCLFRLQEFAAAVRSVKERHKHQRGPKRSSFLLAVMDTILVARARVLLDLRVVRNPRRSSSVTLNPKP